MGKDRGLALALPKALSTARKVALPEAAMGSITWRRPLAPASVGSTNWYWVKPPLPYMRFQCPILSRG